VSEPASSTTVPTTRGAEQPASADGAGGWVHVAEMKELARRKRAQVHVGSCPIALFLIDGEVFAMDDTCTHQERSLSKGTLLAGQVICPGHQWKFDPHTGEAEDQDGRQATYAVQVTEGGSILLDPAPITSRRNSASGTATAATPTSAR
jgi:nitrite reductase/ring-hydroxylating ferredoxin subunit